MNVIPYRIAKEKRNKCHVWLIILYTCMCIFKGNKNYSVLMFLYDVKNISDDSLFSEVDCWVIELMLK